MLLFYIDMDENFKRIENEKWLNFNVFVLFLFRVALSILFYLTCTIPCLWIIHVETANRKLYRLAETKFHSRTFPSPKQDLSSSVLPTTTPLILSLEHIPCHDRVIIQSNHVHLISSSLLGMAIYRRWTLAWWSSRNTFYFPSISTSISYSWINNTRTKFHYFPSNISQ